MSLLILGGTSTTREYINGLPKDVDCFISLATPYGFDEFSKEYPGKTVLIRFTEDTLVQFLAENGIEKVVDTTHPHAKEISRVAMAVCNQQNIPYESHVRILDKVVESELFHLFTTYERAKAFLSQMGFDHILFTIGSNHIQRFKKFASASYVRVLDYQPSIDKCVNAGFEMNRIIAEKGPFSKEYNIKQMHDFTIDCLVTKNSGSGSGLKEKLEACLELQIPAVIIEPKD